MLKAEQKRKQTKMPYTFSMGEAEKSNSMCVKRQGIYRPGTCFSRISFFCSIPRTEFHTQKLTSNY